jgi:hypothetical protein
MSSNKSAGKKLGTFLVIALLVAFAVGFAYINSTGLEGVSGAVSGAANEEGILGGLKNLFS